MVSIALVTILLIHGGVWLSDKLYSWFVGLSAIALAASIFTLLPLAAFKRTGGFSKCSARRLLYSSSWLSRFPRADIIGNGESGKET